MVSTRHPAKAQDLNYLHTDGNRLLDANGDPVLITGLSWFGMETENYAPHGLWARSMDSLLDQIVELGFNTIRLPYSNQLFDPASQPNGINYDLNPELQGLTGLEIMDRVVEGAGARGLKIILDRHRPDSHAQSELWYTDQYSEERWISDWVMLAERYAGDDTVIGVDLHNEPRGQATWGSDDLATDWRLAAERAGEAILAVNPNLLIVVQGVEQYQGESYWWGGNLMGVRDHPVRLSQPDQLVYSPHTYGPGVFPQAWFSDPSFPDNMPGVWDEHWGYIHKEGLAPVIVGEFGGRSVENDQEGIWQRALVAYLKDNQISYLYWTLNPNSGDTGGVLLDDWESIDPQKEALLSNYQFPLIGNEQGGQRPVVTRRPVTPRATQAATQPATAAATAARPGAAPAGTPAAAALSSGLRVRYRNGNPSEQNIDVKPELIIINQSPAPVRLEDLDLVYWFADDPGRTYAYQCDWAQVGCDKIYGEFEALPDGAYALHIRFRSGAGELQPGQESGEIKLRFNRTDWSLFSQTDDYSYSPTTDYRDWDKVALYLRGQLAWGSRPGGLPAGPLPNTGAPGGATSTAAPQSTPSPGTSPTPTGDVPGPAVPDRNLVVIPLLVAFLAGVLAAWLWFNRENR